MHVAIQLSLISLQIGAVYILFALGLTLVFGVMKIVNFAHGVLFSIAALMVAYTMPMLIGAGMEALPAYLLSGLIGVLASLGLGLCMFMFGFKYLQRDLIGSFILAIGLVLLLDSVLLHIFGGAVRSVPDIFQGTIEIFGAQVATQRFVICIAAVIITAALYLALSKTRLGQALRAVSFDHEAAMLQGIPYNRMALVGFMVAAGLAGLAGVLVAPATAVSPSIGAAYLVKGFIAVIIGGLGSVPGAILGALFVAVIETLGGFYFDASWASLAIFVFVIAILLIRPKGILGHG